MFSGDCTNSHQCEFLGFISWLSIIRWRSQVHTKNKGLKNKHGRNCFYIIKTILIYFYSLGFSLDTRPHSLFSNSPQYTLFAPQILHKPLFSNALGNMQCPQEHLKTIVYAKFGGQTKCIMGNSKIENKWQCFNHHRVETKVVVVVVVAASLISPAN